MLAAVQNGNVPKDCSPAAHDFMRRRAIEILGLLKDASAAGPTVVIIGDTEASLALRCDAARCLGLLPLKPGGDPVAGTPAVAQALGDLAASVAETQTERRVLYEQLDDVRVGLNGPNPKTPSGVRAAMPQDQAKLAGELFKLIDDFVKVIDPSKGKYKEEQMVEEAQTLAAYIRDTLPKASPKPKPVNKSEPAPAKTDDTVEPKKADPKAEPAKAAPPKAEPPKAEPAKADPAKPKATP